MMIPKKKGGLKISIGSIETTNKNTLETTYNNEAEGENPHLNLKGKSLILFEVIKAWMLV